ncbi:MAG: hypothetical protein ABIC04_05775 [Nanoarchaeota archaeon]
MILMAFDPNLDKKLFSECKEFETTRVTVAVHQYNEGEKKLQISRENKNKDDDWNFAKLGRLFKDEAIAIIPLMQKALEHM